MFGDQDRLDTATLIAALCDIDDAPWCDWLDGKSDKARGGWLAKKLKPYGIGPKQHRFDEATRKGYLATDLLSRGSVTYPYRTNETKETKETLLPATFRLFRLFRL